MATSFVIDFCSLPHTPTLRSMVRASSDGPVIARRMVGAKRYPSNGVHASMGFAKGSTHPTKLKLIPVIACDKHEAFAQGSEATIAVGTPIAERPPHRTVRAAFPHTAPTSSE